MTADDGRASLLPRRAPRVQRSLGRTLGSQSSWSIVGLRVSPISAGTCLGTLAMGSAGVRFKRYQMSTRQISAVSTGSCHLS